MLYEDQDHRRAGVIVGLLFIIATSFLFLGEAFYRSYLDHSDVLTIAAKHKPIIIFGLMFELMCILAMPLIGAFIYPVLRRISTGFALTYFFFRSLEGIVLINVALTNKFALISLSDAVAAGADPTLAQSAHLLIGAQNAWGNTDGLLYNIIFGLGAICLYSMLFYARLVPRWISIWGLIAIAILLVLVITAMLAPVPDWTALLLVPIGVQEMVMALWFIFRGFDFTTLEANASDTAEVIQ